MDSINGTKEHVNLFNEVNCVCKHNPAVLTNFGHNVITGMFCKFITKRPRHNSPKPFNISAVEYQTNVFMSNLLSSYVHDNV